MQTDIINLSTCLESDARECKGQTKGSHVQASHLRAPGVVGVVGIEGLGGQGRLVPMRVSGLLPISRSLRERRTVENARGRGCAVHEFLDLRWIRRRL